MESFKIFYLYKVWNNFYYRWVKERVVLLINILGYNNCIYRILIWFCVKSYEKVGSSVINIFISKDMGNMLVVGFGCNFIWILGCWIFW